MLLRAERWSYVSQVAVSDDERARMTWQEIRSAHPNRWLVIEAVVAHTDNGRRLLDDIVVVDTCPDGAAAFQRYRELHRIDARRELYYVHTGRDELEIYEQRWVGIRREHAAPST